METHLSRPVARSRELLPYLRVSTVFGRPGFSLTAEAMPPCPVPSSPSAVPHLAPKWHYKPCWQWLLWHHFSWHALPKPASKHTVTNNVFSLLFYLSCAFQERNCRLLSLHLIFLSGTRGQEEGRWSLSSSPRVQK